MEAVLNGDRTIWTRTLMLVLTRLSMWTAGVLPNAGKASNKVSSTKDIVAGAEDIAEEPDEIAARTKALTPV